MSKTEKGDHRYEKVSANGKEKEIESDVIPSYGFGVRHVQALIIFISLCINFMARAHIGVAIVAMVDHSTYEKEIDKFTTVLNDTSDININGTDAVVWNNETVNISESVALSNISMDNETVNVETKSGWNVYRTYKWPKSTQEMILGSFFLGYLIMTFPLGLVSQRWGGKLPIQISLLVNCIVNILTPWCAVWGGWKAVCFCRILQGLSQSGVYPGTINLMAKWSPVSERGRLTTYVLTGTVVGTVLAFQVGGFIAASVWGWPSIFWMTGALCGLAFCLLTFFSAATPHEHKFISEAEKLFITGRIQAEPIKKRRTPWKAILTSRYVWTGFVAHVGSGTSFVFFLTQVPSYLHYILGFDVKKSGLLSSLPYIANFFASIGISSLSDFLTNRNILSLRHSRIICNSIGHFGITLSLAAVSFTTSTTLAVVCLVMGLGTHAGIHTGWMVNYIDLTPNYSGTLMSTGNLFMNVFILTTPMLVSNIVTDVTNPYQWRIILFLVAGLSAISNLVFITFMSSDAQPWNEESYQAADQEDKELEAFRDTKECVK